MHVCCTLWYFLINLCDDPEGNVIKQRLLSGLRSGGIVPLGLLGLLCLNFFLQLFDKPEARNSERQHDVMTLVYSRRNEVHLKNVRAPSPLWGQTFLDSCGKSFFFFSFFFFPSCPVKHCRKTLSRTWLVFVSSGAAGARQQKFTDSLCTYSDKFIQATYKPHTLIPNDLDY